MVVSGRSRRLKNKIPGLTVDRHRTDVPDFSPGRSIDEDDLLFLRVEVAAPPRDVRPDRAGPAGDIDNDPVVSVEVGIPFPGAEPELALAKQAGRQK